MISCTTDDGCFIVFDTRVKDRIFTHNTVKVELYSHSHIDADKTLLAYGDAEIRIFDRRTSKSVSQFVDPNQTSIGHIQYLRERREFVTFGSPTTTVWSMDKDVTKHRYGYDNQSLGPQVSTSGTFFGMNKLVMSDSLGFIRIFEL